MLYRFAETNLDVWLNKSNRKPLVLRGARQVGKSTLVREFARKRKKILLKSIWNGICFWMIFSKPLIPMLL